MPLPNVISIFRSTICLEFHSGKVLSPQCGYQNAGMRRTFILVSDELWIGCKYQFRYRNFIAHKNSAKINRNKCLKIWIKLFTSNKWINGNLKKMKSKIATFCFRMLHYFLFLIPNETFLVWFGCVVNHLWVLMNYFGMMLAKIQIER